MIRMSSLAKIKLWSSENFCHIVGMKCLKNNPTDHLTRMNRKKSDKDIQDEQDLWRLVWFDPFGGTLGFAIDTVGCHPPLFIFIHFGNALSTHQSDELPFSFTFILSHFHSFLFSLFAIRYSLFVIHTFTLSHFLPYYHSECLIHLSRRYVLILSLIAYNIWVIEHHR